MRCRPRFVLSVLLLITASPAVNGWAQTDSRPSPAPEWVQEVDQLLDQRAYEQARQRLTWAAQSDADPQVVETMARRIDAAQQARLEALSGQLDALLEDRQSTKAEQLLVQLIALGAEQDTIKAYRVAIENSLKYGRYQPGNVFQDPWQRPHQSNVDQSQPSPTMVVLPQGRFMMGSARFEQGHRTNEAPRHRVTIPSGFAMSQTEITVAQFRAFVQATGYRTHAERSGRGRVYDPKTRRITQRQGMDWRSDYRGQPALDTLPVVRVSWSDAQAYVAWLSRMTGHRYRLPSEAEFEYALRAGQQWRFPWGDEPPREPVDNVAGEADRSPTGAQWAVSFPNFGDGHWGPAPVGEFQPNRFGLYDTGGNVSEWTEDCWHDNYVRAPKNGAPWVNRGCDQRVIRGGAWTSTPLLARAAHRQARSSDWADVQVGFRVVRALEP